MATNVEVTKNGGENNLSVLRRFTKRVQGSGVLPRIRGRRYAKRLSSEYTKKKMALKKIGRQKEVSFAIKMGKMVATNRN
jgi:ribosomal protein S21